MIRSKPTTVRGELVEARFDSSVTADPTPLIDLIDGRRTNDHLAPGEWLDGLEVTGGRVAIYFGLPADHEWYLGYDPAFEGGGDEFEGPFCRWSTYPSGGWDFERQRRGTLEMVIEDFSIGIEDSGIRRSRVVRLQDAPEFVRDELE
jgi:hypothetical protein